MPKTESESERARERERDTAVQALYTLLERSSLHLQRPHGATTQGLCRCILLLARAPLGVHSLRGGKALPRVAQAVLPRLVSLRLDQSTLQAPLLPPLVLAVARCAKRRATAVSAMATLASEEEASAIYRWIWINWCRVSFFVALVPSCLSLYARQDSHCTKERGTPRGSSSGLRSMQYSFPPTRLLSKKNALSRGSFAL